jgi:hypothetical protein
MNGDAETWKPVVGYEGQYEVSNQGRVRSLYRVIYVRRFSTKVGAHIDVYKPMKGRIMRLNKNARGYLVCHLGRGVTKAAHQMVLESFVGPCPPGQMGLHADDNKENNVLNNLRWGTSSENAYDSIRNNTFPSGERSPRAKLRKADVAIIKSLFGEKQDVEIARIYGVDRATIRKIRIGKTWKSAA